LIVAAVIPCREEERYLPFLLDSLEQQTRRPDLTVVASYSSDRTNLIAQQRGCIIVWLHRQGIGYARNVGAREAQRSARCDPNELAFLFLDADVVLPADAVGKALSHFSDPDVLLVHAGWRPEYPEGSSPSVFDWIAHWFVDQMKPLWWTSGRLILVKARPFWEIGGFDEQMVPGEDRDFGWRFLERFGPQSMVYDPSTQVGHSLRRIRKHGYTLFWEEWGVR
jgi:glycosyltransferase involved in cell wall biosynthesis